MVDMDSTATATDAAPAFVVVGGGEVEEPPRAAGGGGGGGESSDDDDGGASKSRKKKKKKKKRGGGGDDVFSPLTRGGGQRQQRRGRQEEHASILQAGLGFWGFGVCVGDGCVVVVSCLELLSMLVLCVDQLPPPFTGHTHQHHTQPTKNTDRHPRPGLPARPLGSLRPGRPARVDRGDRYPPVRAVFPSPAPQARVWLRRGLVGGCVFVCGGGLCGLVAVRCCCVGGWVGTTDASFIPPPTLKSPHESHQHQIIHTYAHT